MPALRDGGGRGCSVTPGFTRGYFRFSLRENDGRIDWLRGKGEGHLTRINDILANLMEAERRIGSGR
jgi:hypothetical protein